jgi:F-type H+-transporting ATPase subunit b
MRLMSLLALQVAADSGSRIEQVARTFGVDWSHLIAQTVSFGIVCLVLYALAYKPILKMLEARQEQIATGLANAEQIRAELARIQVERRDVLMKAEAEGERLIDEARAAAARIQAEDIRQAKDAAEQILSGARDAAVRDRARMRAELTREMGRLVAQTTAAVTGKILTADDHRRLAEEAARHLGTSG